MGDNTAMERMRNNLPVSARDMPKALRGLNRRTIAPPSLKIIQPLSPGVDTGLYKPGHLYHDRTHTHATEVFVTPIAIQEQRRFTYDAKKREAFVALEPEIGTQGFAANDLICATANGEVATRGLYAGMHCEECVFAGADMSGWLPNKAGRACCPSITYHALVGFAEDTVDPYPVALQLARSGFGVATAWNLKLTASILELGGEYLSCGHVWRIGLEKRQKEAVFWYVPLISPVRETTEEEQARCLLVYREYIEARLDRVYDELDSFTGDTDNNGTLEATVTVETVAVEPDADGMARAKAGAARALGNLAERKAQAAAAEPEPELVGAAPAAANPGSNGRKGVTI